VGIGQHQSFPTIDDDSGAKTVALPFLSGQPIEQPEPATNGIIGKWTCVSLARGRDIYNGRADVLDGANHGRPPGIVGRHCGMSLDAEYDLQHEQEQDK
jgi:hypothetical protein